MSSFFEEKTLKIEEIKQKNIAIVAKKQQK
jgi:hypothetical protein